VPEQILRWSQSYSPSTSMSLLGKASLGDREAWEQIVYLYSPLVDQWCRRRPLNADAIAGIGQDVFLVLLKNLGQFKKDKPSHGFRKWLWRVTTNEINNYLRKVRNEPQGMGGSAAREIIESYPDRSAEPRSMNDDRPGRDDEGLIVLRRALELVKTDFEPRTYEAFREVVLNERPPADVARSLNLKSVGAVYTAKSRVMKRLRELLDQLGEDMPGR
jgi:RNA polymerase sigma-70 factor (ECF subfamily)